jgi:acetyl esterase/lipase
MDNSAEIERCLSDELMRGWEPSLYAPTRTLSLPVSPSAFFDRYADQFGSIPLIKERLEAFHLKESDRLVVEETRGMLIAVRTTANSSRVIAIVLGGFQPPSFILTRDVIYGRKFGTVLTLDVIQPKKGGNRAAVLHLISGTFSSSPPAIGSTLHARQQGLVDLGYTVIYVTHSCAPWHPISEIVGDIRRAVRFIRFHASRLDLDPDRIAVMGSSSGGYLALTAGTSEGDALPFPPAYDLETPPDHPSDPVQSVSGKATAVVAYYPVTDWMNYGETGKTVFDSVGFHPYLGILDQYDYDDKTNGLIRVSDRKEQLRRLKALSPVNQAGRSFAPTLLFHGGKDANVPLQQSESMARILKASGADVELVVKPNEGHGWPDNAEDQKTLVDWLDRRLLKKGR